MKKKFAICGFIAILVTGCVQHSKDYKRIQAENDSLKLEAARSESEVNEMLSILNSIEDDIKSVREAENFVDINKDRELTASRREQIKGNMTHIVETLQKNRKQLDELQEKMKSGNIKIASLQKTIDRLTNDIEEKTLSIATLQNDLKERENQVRDLSEKVENLNTDIEILTEMNDSQNKTIEQQDQAINTIYYCFGTKKELKDQQILTGGGIFSKSKALQGDFNRDYFISTDMRKLTYIPLYSGKAKVHTTHPQDSYELIKDSDKNLTLKIKDKDKFWSMGKFLVIEVK